MTLKELQKMIKEEFDAYVGEAEDDVDVSVSDNDIDAEMGDMGDDIVRFQIPIRTNNHCWFAITDCEMEEEWTEENSHTLRGFNKKFKPRFKNFKMVAGHIHTFNVKLNHSMFNEGHADRVTLSIDCKKNEWLDKFLDGFRKQ